MKEKNFSDDIANTISATQRSELQVAVGGVLVAGCGLRAAGCGLREAGRRAAGGGLRDAGGKAAGRRPAGGEAAGGGRRAAGCGQEVGRRVEGEWTWPRCVLCVLCAHV